MSKLLILLCALTFPLLGNSEKTTTIQPILFGYNEICLKIAPPADWEISNLLLNGTATSQFTLLPEIGNHKVNFEITYFNCGNLAIDALTKKRKKTKSTTSIDNGFETKFFMNHYCCMALDRYLIEIKWYLNLNNPKKSQLIWEKAKQCITLSENFTPDKTSERQPIEKTPKGWVCHHPENKVDLFFNDAGITSVNTDPFHLYSIKFDNFNAEGYLYVKWDQYGISTNQPYFDHLNEMMLDITNIESSQFANSDIKFDLEEGYARIEGSPYSLITLSADNFLFGFAYKLKSADADINDLIRTVLWKTHS